MDFDLEIINEETDCPDPLFDSIMNAMNSMKEATADKIYQKIQREGETNYSKPQVDRALANALKYGIFEVRNNRYRVRDDVLDDEDTVYYKLQKKKERSPFQIQEDINERQFGPKLDPEKDNRRFRRMVPKKPQECPHCGRIKKPVTEEAKTKTEKKVPVRKCKISKKPKQVFVRQRTESKSLKKGKPQVLADTRTELKRKQQLEDIEEREPKIKKHDHLLEEQSSNEEDNILCDPRDEMILSAAKRHNETHSNLNLVPGSEESLGSYLSEENRDQNQPHLSRSLYSPDFAKMEEKLLKANTSGLSIKSESGSENTSLSTASNEHSQTKVIDSFLENLPCTSRNANGKNRNQCLDSNELYGNDQIDQSKPKPEWLGCTEEPQKIIQTNNVLTIEPIDSLAFKSQEHTSYIS